MKRCEKCHAAIKPGDERECDSTLLCEDCYIDTLLPAVGKTFYESDSVEFFRRLQHSYSTHKQRFH